MGLRGRLFALAYDRMGERVERAGLGALRRRLLADASGTVLEIGAGTGANLPHYDPGVASLTVTEPEAPMLLRAAAPGGRGGAGPASSRRRRLRTSRRGRRLGSRRCQRSALRRRGSGHAPCRRCDRVLRPGGRLLFIEHVRSDDPGLAPPAGPPERAEPVLHLLRLQPPHPRLHPRRGFEVERVQTPTLQGLPSLVRPLIAGMATAPSPAPSRQGPPGDGR